MVDLSPAVERLAEKAKTRIPINPGDYQGDDGLWYCGKCNTRKQSRISYMGRELMPMCLCKCESERVNAEMEKERHERYREELLTKCFTSDDMKEWRFEADNGNNPKLTEICRNFVDNFGEFRSAGRGLLLYGSTGVGKSWSAGCIANALIDREVACKFLDFTQIANILMDMGNGRNDYIQTLARYPLLILDDLDAERNTSYMDEIVFSVIDARAKARNPLIVTTNLTRDKLKDPKGITEKRIISRLYELCIPYEVVGEDQRERELRKDYGHFKHLLGI